jgi:hypothetical protein
MNKIDNLANAGKIYSSCAAKVKTRTPSGVTPNATDLELLIAFGIASSWTRRAAYMAPITYTEGKSINKTATFDTELVRFSMAWSGMNALFSRPAVLALFGARPLPGELANFTTIVSNAQLNSSRTSALEANLRAVLETPVKVSTLTGHAPGTLLPTFQVLHEKYTPVSYQGMGIGRKLQDSIQIGDANNLDLPTIIYAMRNWSLHGSLLGSSFRSASRFSVFIDTINDALSEIHSLAASKLLANI